MRKPADTQKKSLNVRTGVKAGQTTVEWMVLSNR
jgi:hypothetical protein